MHENVAVVVLTLNPGEIWRDWIVAFKNQDKQPDCYVIDSGSDDDTPTIAVDNGLNLYTIERTSFNHGGTRNYALDICADYEYIVYMTQDAILADSTSLTKILKPFDDQQVAAVCGRQLPNPNAGVIETHARLYNYPDVSRVTSMADVGSLGLKTAFLSNSFAAYRISALREVSGFPGDVIFGEDMYTAARLLQADYTVAYAADACVYHSHDYSMTQEFKRYFDMGVFHAREPWLKQEFGSAESEGVKFIISELKYLAKHEFWRIPEALLRTVLKYIGFKLGLSEGSIPLKIKKKTSLNTGYFKTE